MGRAKYKSVFEDVQNVYSHHLAHAQSSGYFLSIETVYGIQWFCL